MRVQFCYDSENIDIVPIEIRFFTKIGSVGQLYIVFPMHIATPKSVKIANLFVGNFVFEQIQNQLKVVYFVNEFLHQDTNYIFYYDTFNNKIIAQPNQLIDLKNKIQNIQYNVKHLPYKNIEISAESLHTFTQLKYDNLSPEEEVMLRTKTQNKIDLVHKCIALYASNDGILVKNITLRKFDKGLIMQYITNYLSNQCAKLIMIGSHFEVKVGNLVKLNDVTWTIWAIEHYITYEINKTILFLKNIPQSVQILQKNNIISDGNVKSIKQEGKCFVVFESAVSTDYFDVLVNNYE